MRRIVTILCIMLMLFGAGNVANAYTANITYYLDGLDVDTGAIYTDPTTFLILPEDTLETMLQPPANILPNFDPAVDVFVEYKPMGDLASLVFLPKAMDDPMRFVAITIGSETIPIDVSGLLTRIDIPVGQPITFLAANNEQYDVNVKLTWNKSSVPGTPEPSTLILLGLGLFGILGITRNRKYLKRTTIVLLLVTEIAGIVLFTGIQPVAAQISFSCSNVTEIPQIECEALVALYNSTNGANWTNNTNWLQTNTPCSWQGVACGNGHVTKIGLAVNNLDGTIPPEIGNLTEVYELSMWRNKLRGNIPATIGNMRNLIGIGLEENPSLTGNIPKELGNLTKLQGLDLSGCQLTGEIPAELGNLANLTDLLLHFNRLTGAIPAQLGNLVNLRQLRLDNNQLTGNIPPELGNLSPDKLEALFLAGNQLTGNIPATLGNLTSLKGLQLNNNQLNGKIPSTLGNLHNLAGLDLSTNQLEGNIPTELGNLQNLTVLRLFDNQLNGNIPGELGNLIKLRECILHSNQLIGNIPMSFENLTNVEVLTTRYNYLSGCLPIELMPHTDMNTGEKKGLWALQEFDFHAMYGDQVVKEPADSGFQTWLSTFPHVGRTNILCNAVSAEKWEYACDNANTTTVEILGTDFHVFGGGQKARIEIPNPETVQSLLVQTRSSQGATVTFESSTGEKANPLQSGTLYDAQMQPAAWVEATITGGDFDTFFVYVFRKTDQQQTNVGMLPRLGKMVWYPDNSQTVTLTIPATSDSRNVDVTFTLMDLNDDGRSVIVEAQAGDLPPVSKTYVNTTPEKIALTGGLITTLTIPNVPGNVTNIKATVKLPPQWEGDSVEFAGVNANVDCADVYDWLIYEHHVGNVQDADKIGNNDSHKCSMAATANILPWGTWGVSPNYQTAQQIFGYFQTNLTNKGSLVKYVSRCWIDGIMPPNFGADWATATACPGYFPTGSTQSNFAGAYLSHWTQATLIETIKSYLHSGYGTTIALYDSKASDALGHVLSVWGYRYDKDNKVLGVWVTDSDDAATEPPQEWLLPIEYTQGSGDEMKWRVSASSPHYANWLIEGAEALKPRTATQPATELPRLAIVRKKCLDNDTGAEIACPANDNVTVYIGDKVCDNECKRMTVAFDANTALKLQVLIDFDPKNPVTFKGWEVNGQIWTGGAYTLTGDVFLRPVIGCRHDPN